MKASPMTKTPDADEVRAFAEQVARRLREAGHRALFAGGCVRDLLFGKIPKDYDVATSARPEQVQALFPRTVAVGVSFGVVRVVKGSKLGVEVATFHSDGDYRDGRHPVSVRFADAKEDALRRDFTINGMFLDPTDGSVLDFVGGRDDLAAKIIRAIGDPERRFEEDKLRLLRAVRFAARLDFEIEEATFAAVQRMAPALNEVSGERILTELRWLMEGASRGRGYALLAASELGRVVFEEIPANFDDVAMVKYVSQRLDLLPSGAPFPVSIAVVFAARSGADACCERFFKRLKGSNDERELAVWLLKHADDLLGVESRPLSYRKRLFAHPNWRWLVAFSTAIGFEIAAAWCERERESLSPEEIDPPPLVTGDDLLRVGFAPGPDFKVWLERIRDLQLDGELTSPDDAVELVKRWSSRPKP